MINSNSNNNTIIISASMIAGAIMLSSVLFLTRNGQPTPPISTNPRPASSPVVIDSPAAVASNLPPVSSIPSVQSSLPATISRVNVFIPSPTPVAIGRPKISRQVSQNQGLRSSISPLPVVKKMAMEAVAARFIQNYYSKLHSANYQRAWQDLSPEFQHNRSANPGGYGGEYIKWWSRFGRQTQVSKIETVKATNNRAIVRAHCRFQGDTYIAQYYLRFDAASQSWKIDKIKKLA